MTEIRRDRTSSSALREALAPHVESGSIPGLVALVARGPNVQVEVIGHAMIGDVEPIREDAIFRIASITKPIVAAVTMLLVQDGVLAVEAPVDDLLPELANRRVLRSLDAELDDTVPAKRPITLDDLLTFRLGFGAVMEAPDRYPIQRAEAELQLKSLGPPWPPVPDTADAWIGRLGRLPLMDQPGEHWRYNTGAQVLGVLLERATGQPLGQLLAERLLEPLGMVDTGFSVPAASLDRFTTAYQPDPTTGEPVLLDSARDSWWASEPTFPNAAGWLASTASDCSRSWWTMTGERSHPELLSEATRRQMTTDQLTPAQRAEAPLFFGAHQSWGLGMAVPASGIAFAVRPGGFGWDGGLGATWRSDPATGLTGILLTLRAMTSPEPPQVFTDFWRAAYLEATP